MSELLILSSIKSRHWPWWHQPCFLNLGFVMKVLTGKEKEWFITTKNKARKSNLSQDSSAASCKQLHGNTSLEADHLSALPSTWVRPHLICLELLTHEKRFWNSWDARLFIRKFFLARSSSDGWGWRSFLVRAPLHSNKKQLLLCQPLGGKTFKKSPQFICGLNWITWASIALT